MAKTLHNHNSDTKKYNSI